MGDLQDTYANNHMEKGNNLLLCTYSFLLTIKQFKL